MIAIIAILAAILFPVFAKAREKARQTSCLSNLKQIALSAQMYVQDYDETLPLDTNWPQPWYQFLLPDVLNPYAKNYQLWICPTDYYSVTQSAGVPAFDTYWSPNFTQISYAYNYALGKRDGPLKLGKIRRPAECCLFADAENYDFCSQPRRLALAGLCGAGNWTGTALGSQWEIDDNTRHNGGENIAYCDGHVKWQNFHAILEATGPNVWTNCNNAFWRGY